LVLTALPIDFSDFHTKQGVIQGDPKIVHEPRLLGEFFELEDHRHHINPEEIIYFLTEPIFDKGFFS
jgi:hypothetical protein